MWGLFPRGWRCCVPALLTSSALRFSLLLGNVLGPVPGVDVMAKRPQGWVKCEDRLPYCRDSSCSLPLPRLHDHNSTTREDEDLAARGGGGGARGKGPARVGLLGLQCSARALFRTASFKKMSRASHL
jgi:hypothetical protein